MTDKWVEYRINKSKFSEFIGYVATADDKCGSWWLPTADGGQLRIMVAEDLA